MTFKCFDIGITPVSIEGGLINETVTFETKGISGEVRILKRSLPLNLVSSALISTGALRPVLNRMAIPGGAPWMLRTEEEDATGLASKINDASPNYFFNHRLDSTIHGFPLCLLTIASGG